MSWQFTVGLRVKGKADRIVVDAEDALIAALRAKAHQPGAMIMYVRRSNRRGDTRHPPRPHTEAIEKDMRSFGSFMASSWPRICA
jgi:hypothetical protein